MKKLTFSVVLFILNAMAIAQVVKPVDMVNTFIGTTGPAGVKNYGGVCPWVTTPHGMTDWTPMTQENFISQLPFRYEQKKIIGFMGSHQPTIWMGDYGYITIMPESGKVKILPEDRGMEILPGSQVAKPYYYSVKLENGSQQNIHVEMTASARCGIFKFTFPEGNDSHLFIEMSRLAGHFGWIKISKDHRKIIGYNPDRDNVFSGNHMGPELKKFKGYFVIQFEKSFDSFSTWNDSCSVQIYNNKNEMSGSHIGALVTFSTKKNEVIKVKIGSSFISLDQARENLKKEIPGWDFEQVENHTKQDWNKALSRIEVEGGTPDQQTIFYTAMYHSLVFPRRFDEYGRYYSPFDEKIHKGVSYNDYSMWDTFRALHPLLTLMDPEGVSPMIQSMVQMYEQGGWIPKWPNPTYTNIMIGTPADAIIADAFVKGFRNYDLKKAYAAIYKDATIPPDLDTLKRWADRANWTTYEARAGLTYYKKLGYVPADKTNESVSCTLEFALEDYCVAQVAKGLGKEKDYKFFMKRSENYKNLFDPATGFMQPRLSDGEFYLGNPAKYRAFTEGSPWTYLFCVMQDVPGLVKLMGRNEFIARLDSNFSAGHYAYDNEPENHYPYLYDWINQPWKSQKILTDVVEKNYRNTPDGITGNDDCGQMSAWYIFTTLGFYSVCPASGEYAIGRPFFPKAKLHLTFPEKNTLTIVAKNLSPENIYVKSIKLDGQPLKRLFLKYSDLFKHKVLEFYMTNTPNKFPND
ncbi:MAG: GH92 family glycosyl hydrolase [Ignavibacteriaceae bacterium]